MERHKVELTTHQINTIINALQYDINDDFGANDPDNRRIMRIIKKLEKVVEK